MKILTKINNQPIMQKDKVYSYYSQVFKLFFYETLTFSCVYLYKYNTYGHTT